MESVGVLSEDWHGSSSDVGYTRHGCRCPECRRAHRDVVWLYRQKRAREGRPVRRKRAALPQVGDKVKHPRLGWGIVAAVDIAERRLTVRHRAWGTAPGVLRSYRAKIIVGHRDRNNITELLAPGSKPRNTGRERLSTEQLDEAAKLRALGWYYRELGERYGVHPGTVEKRLKARIIADGLRQPRR